MTTNKNNKINHNNRINKINKTNKTNKTKPKYQIYPVSNMEFLITYIHLNLQLIDAESKNNLWTETNFQFEKINDSFYALILSNLMHKK
jgi:hypothetical protein